MANSLSITAQMDKIMSDYNSEVQKAVDESAKEAADLCVNQLKNTSPKRPGHGEYARSWTIKTRRIGLSTEYTVHNSKHYQLTHLLENGHVVRNKYGTYGRARPIKHIAPAADTSIQRFDLACRTRIGRLK